MRRIKSLIAVLLCLSLAMTGCVDQNAAPAQAGDAVGNGGIAVTSIAVMQICEKLGLDLVGVPQSSLVEIPQQYQDATVVGSPMSPDMEILAQLAPEWVLSPASLQNDLQPKYEAAGLKYGFLNLKTIFGMYQSIADMGELFDCKPQADALVAEFEAYYRTYQEQHQNQPSPSVLILMGLPGSYVVATENSYVGSLVEMAGGRNVYAGTDQEFLNVNTEDMLQKDPDIILRTAHAMPESVMQMFAEEFQTNDIWKHFSAVENNRVYDLPNGYFGMSANFNYPQALETLDQLLYSEATGGNV